MFSVCLTVMFSKKSAAAVTFQIPLKEHKIKAIRGEAGGNVIRLLANWHPHCSASPGQMTGPIHSVADPRYNHILFDFETLRVLGCARVGQPHRNGLDFWNNSTNCTSTGEPNLAGKWLRTC